MKTISILSIFWMLSFSTMGQELIVPRVYHKIISNDTADTWHILYVKEFMFRKKAIRYHLGVLDLNDIDITRTRVSLKLNTPIFSHFVDEIDKDIVYITYVTNRNGKYASVFIECKNIPMEFFESDGKKLYYTPIRETIKM